MNNDVRAAAERLTGYDLAHFQGPTERDADIRCRRTSDDQQRT